ncbi:MAG: phosphoenolpyruvate--protein phosphotransferase [Chloroflexota bacterium]|nr:MAG: phosphoenolpyruvate--protein phosphotransferase [Chloroflexota bacterium]
MKQLKGIAASPGIACGLAFIYAPLDLSIPDRAPDDAPVEWERCRGAFSAAMGQLQDLRSKAALEFGEAEAAIFDAHKMILCDPDLEEELKAELQTGATAEAAVDTVFRRVISSFEELEDPLFRERAADFADVHSRLLCILLHIQKQSLARLDSPVIIVALDLLPSDTAQMDRARVRGFCTARGGALSHTAILARNLGLPAVTGLGDGVLALADQSQIIVDGNEGVVIAEADEQQWNDYQQRAQASMRARAADETDAHRPAVTLDGLQVEVVANIGLPGEEVGALQAGAEGIGLLRTEFLFTGRHVAPGEDEQFEAYRPIFETMGNLPVIARTLDIGGDKPAPFLNLPGEANPYLGFRAVRIGLARPEMLKTQLRALLRAGYNHTLRIMFPMVATVEEMQAALGLVEESRLELANRGLPFAEAVEVGTMIEIPSAALISDQLAPHVDFFSIGSNDLTQYTLAADRGNPAVAWLTDSLHPAVLRLVDYVIHQAHAAKIWVGMCGEMAGDLDAIPVLLGLGLDEFSMGAASIPAAKALIRRLSVEGTKDLARQALAQPGAPSVRTLVRNWRQAQEKNAL